MKRIIFCADGTWCHPNDPSSGGGVDSNVYKLFKMFPVTATQLPHYDDGIGAKGSFLQRVVEGAFGEGLFGKIKEGYTKIAHDYVDGDSIYLFGFSRGAYTARSIAGMIACSGLPDQDGLEQSAIEDAFAAYRKQPGSPERAAAVQQLRTRYGNRPVGIEMIGVWDTVGALGIPSLFGGVDPVRYGFLDVTLSSRVHAAYQALALDEQRREFPPTLWEDCAAPGQILEQVWFSGCHGNIGGGCPHSSLSDIALKWMIDKCLLHELEVDPVALEHYRATVPTWALDPVDVPWPGYALLAPARQRAVAQNAAIANTVAARLTGMPTYAPGNLVLTTDRELASSYRSVAI